MTAIKRTINRKRSRPIEIKKNYPNKKTIGMILIIIAIVVISAVFILTREEKGNPIAVIDTSMGTIKVELFEDKVPNTCENFINYANEDYYNGLVFHRVIDDFMIQGGGFYQNGTQKVTNDPIDLEINDNVRHVDGAIAMARTNDPNSATSQFYICDGAQSFLDDNYAAFGIVIEGIEVVRSIASVDTTTKNNMSDWPVNDVIINSITIENQ
jgi:cyclophilin family peptidyl-prolyl cis-trans isomerase